MARASLDRTSSCDDSQSMTSLLSRQTLLIDADDTLWENNIYFERAIAGFIAYLDHREHTPAEVRRC